MTCIIQWENLPWCDVTTILHVSFLWNSFPETRRWRNVSFVYSLFFLSLRRILCLKLYLSVNLIIVPHPVNGASSWGIAKPYITPPLCTNPLSPASLPRASSPSFSFFCMFMLMICQNTSAGLPPSSVTSLPFLLRRNAVLGLRALKMHVCFVPLLLINIDGKSQRNHRGPDVRAAVEQPGEGDILRESVTVCKWAIKSQVLFGRFR